ncbi:quinol dehydrogenase ferredoxin subunit NapH [Cohaesibacter gelatinilyticus]|uniref:Ferredoxin-type protein NapH n=1 Tax=Cohaesibacter gelatinilyticus TaxID=372072 RepID=A0A285NIH0_9HYPH|nr:quinol dehydrogenase ferredoxin subunit NapH [Cohaesibacter gelatinilyticus]SNZ07656.1 ferredoxin-type protein NapH [Cohaesibacter gelatinilyticus]
MKMSLTPGKRAFELHGFWFANRYLIARRLTQVFFIALFLTGPWFGIWIAEGNLASSWTLDFLPLTDPLILIQGLLAGNWPELVAIVGALIVTIAYLLVGGRAYCAWVCPINPITDLAALLRRKLDIKKGWTPKRNLRLYVLAGILITTLISGTLVWELINPITSLHRAILFGTFVGAMASLAIFLFDLFTAQHGWCGHLCPVGAFYGLLGEGSILRVSAVARDRCDDCMDCFAICPEPQVIAPALRGERTGTGPLILSGDCINCGRCLDVCSENVFRFTHRFDQRLQGASLPEDAGQLCQKGG